MTDVHDGLSCEAAEEDRYGLAAGYADFKADAERLAKRVSVLESALKNLILDDPWLFDRDGDGALECVFCETIRGHIEGCPHEEARALLEDPDDAEFRDAAYRAHRPL